MMQTWRLDTREQTMVLAATHNHLPQIIYWGALLPASENLQTIAKASQIDRTGGMLDDLVDLSICPQSTDPFPGHPGLILRTTSGNRLFPHFFFTPSKTKPITSH